MDDVTTENIRSWSKIDFVDLGYPKKGEDADLQVLLDRAVEYVNGATGRKLYETSFPADLERTAQEAVQRRVEQLIYEAQEDFVEMGADFEQIQSFNVTGYSETRRSMKDYKEAKLINPWPHLHELLWAMTTDDKKDDWYQTWGIMPPAFAVTETDWQQNTIGPEYTGH